MTAPSQHSRPSRRTAWHGGWHPAHAAGAVRWSLPVVLMLAAAIALVLGTLLTQRQSRPVQAAPAVATQATAPAPVTAPTPAAPLGAGDVRLTDLPALGQQVYQSIHQGGPFAFDKDGVVFANREGRLPRQPRGYYHEYTVAHANADNRGARRIVCGGAPRTPEVCYYTADHYNTFKRIVP